MPPRGHGFCRRQDYRCSQRTNRGQDTLPHEQVPRPDASHTDKLDASATGLVTRTSPAAAPGLCELCHRHASRANPPAAFHICERDNGAELSPMPRQRHVVDPTRREKRKPRRPSRSMGRQGQACGDVPPRQDARGRAPLVGSPQAWSDFRKISQPGHPQKRPGATLPREGRSGLGGEAQGRPGGKGLFVTGQNGRAIRRPTSRHRRRGGYPHVPVLPTPSDLSPESGKPQ